MEVHQLAVHERFVVALERMSHSALADKYREASGLVKEILLRILEQLKERVSHSETIRLIKDLGKSYLRHLARRVSIVSPYLHKALENRITIAYVSLLLGFIGGRYCMRGYPQLQPQQMLSVVCGSYSGAESVAMCRIPVPRLCSNYQVTTTLVSLMMIMMMMYQVLVKVMSAGLDKSDLMAVSGWARLERGKPHGGFTLGRDFCGIVVEAGLGVTHVSPGDRVWGAVPYHVSGTLSEQIVVSGSHVTRMPSNLNWEGGATVPYSTVMTWSALVTSGHLTPDQCAGTRVLVVDSVTDTGCLSVQLCCIWGCHVTAVTSPRAAQLAAALGAHKVITLSDYDFNSDVIEELKRAGPYNLIVQCGDKALSDHGLSLIRSPTTKVTSTVPTSLSTDGWGTLRRLLHPVWRSLVSPPHSPRPTSVTESLQYVRQAVQKGKLQPVLDTVLAPADVGPALSKLATDDAVGKSVVLFDRL